MRRLICKYCLHQEIYPMKDRAGRWVIVKTTPEPFTYAAEAATTDGWVLFVNRNRQGFVVHLRDLPDSTLHTVREILAPHYCAARQKQLYDKRLDRQIGAMQLSTKDLTDPLQDRATRRRR